MQQVNILLVTSASTPARIREGWYRYTISCGKVSKTGEGKIADTTGNRLVMTALIAALERMTRPAMIRIITDCRYLINGFQMLQIWQQAGYRTAKGVPLKNTDLWERLYELKGAHAISWMEQDTKLLR